MVLIRKISVALLFGLLSCNEGNKDKVVSIIEKDRPIDKIRLKDLDGTPINLEKYQGETVFINFWATWCKPCLQEMPSIEKAQQFLQNENVVFLLASAETIEEIGTFRKLNTYPFNYVQIQNSEELSIDGLPTTFIFDKEGSGECVIADDGGTKAIIAELLGTFALAYVVLNVATAKGTDSTRSGTTSDGVKPRQIIRDGDKSARTGETRCDPTGGASLHRDGKGMNLEL